MFKKTVLAGLTGLALASSLSAVNLDQFNSDFGALIQGIGRDAAPSLMLGALAGDLQGEASIQHFSITPLALSVNTTNGLGTILQPGAYNWQYVIHLDDMVNNNVSSTFFEHLMLYPSMKMAVGMAFGTWDVTLSGMYFPQAFTGALSNVSSSVSKLSPQFSFGNIGVEVRKGLVADSGGFGWVPGLSLGLGYHLTFFNLATTITSLSDIGIGAQSVGANQTMDLNGTLQFNTLAQVGTVDLHVSKHLAFFTPYVKFSGAYQNSTFTGNTNLTATVTDSSNSANDSTQKINSNPVVNVSDFAFLANPGLEIDIFAFILNINALIDVGRANLNISSFTLDGINANAIVLNAGFRIAF
jgi:hypothetical protein